MLVVTPSYNGWWCLEQVEQERDRYSRQTQESVPMSQPFQIISKFTLDPDEAAYKLTLEIPTPIGKNEHGYHGKGLEVTWA